MKSTSQRPRASLEIMMTPMIDVIFLLLIFFLTTSGAQQIERLMPGGVSSINPASGPAAEPPREPSPDQLEQIVLKLTVDGEVTGIQFNGLPIAASELLPRFQAVFQARPDVPMIIDPDPKVKAQEVVKIYDTARQVGLARVYLATRKR